MKLEYFLIALCPAHLTGLPHPLRPVLWLRLTAIQHLVQRPSRLGLGRATVKTRKGRKRG